MESEFPSNSSRQRAEKVEKPEPKKIEKVIQGEVVRRKKPLGTKFKELFGGGNAKATLGFIMMDVLLPAAKDAIADAVSQGVERMIFGEARSSSRRTGMRPRGGGSNSFVNYNYRSSSSSPSRDSRHEEPRNQVSRRARTSHDFDEIILSTRVEAEEVIDRLFDLVSKFEMASVADLYELCGVSGNYTDQNYGWTDLRGAGVTRIRNGYLLDLPKPELLD